jgi:hypothetical protein
MGAKPIREDRDKYRVLPVSKVIHQIITKLDTEEPNRETSCPDQNNR